MDEENLDPSKDHGNQNAPKRYIPRNQDRGLKQQKKNTQSRRKDSGDSRNETSWRNQTTAQSLNRPPVDPRPLQQRVKRERQPYKGMQRNQGHGSGDVQAHDDFRRERGNMNDNNSSLALRQNRNNRNIGFKALQEIASSDPLEVLAKINERIEPFHILIGNPVEADMHVLIVQILSIVSTSTFDNLKLRILLDVLNSQYLTYLKNFLMDLPYTEDKKRNRFYWNNQDNFWKNLIYFCETVFNSVPSVAMQKCRSLVYGSIKVCLEELKDRHSFVLSKESTTRLDELRERIKISEKDNDNESKEKDLKSKDQIEEEPPEDFRQLSVIPQRDDMLNQRPYLRANVVRGGYRDVEHYLDVQFRLLREDCFGPLREGLLQYITDPNKKKYDNMRVYRNVQFLGPYVSNDKSGLVIQLDESTIKRFKGINWSYSKRFIYGSLLLFSKDHCKNFITATILDRETKYLSHGMIPVSVVDNENLLTSDNIIKSKESYVMFESEVYFEPYLHVLKALQDPNFTRHVAMSKYIVDVDPVPRPPQYLNHDVIFEVDTPQSPETKFTVLDALTWPSQEDLGLNESQFEAYKLALTHEFAVIQGPPGTGKTYLGVKVAKTLLKNVLPRRKNKCLMLIICYTNHALDQFLEHILDITTSIVRVGGQSRNEAIKNISLNNLRRSSTKKYHLANNLYYSEKRNLQSIIGKLRTAQKQIESLSNGILTYNCIRRFVPEVMIPAGYAQPGKDRLLSWLMESVDDNVLKNIEDLVVEQINTNIEEKPTNSNTTDERTDYIVDELLGDIEIDINGIEVQTSFLLNTTELTINQLASLYKKSTVRNQREKLYKEIQTLHFKKCVFQEMRKMYRLRGVPRPVIAGESLGVLPAADRWAIYFTWANTAINQIRELIKPLQEEFKNAAATYEEARMNLDLHLLEGISVVGMTTSGATRLRKLLNALAPPVVIVEEAAEVLEQHIVTSLSEHCKHLILIGDHQQLRPSAAYMKLARHYEIEVSLFERMILNGMHSRRLCVQHRMRPEVAALISPHIYSDLANHPSVEAFPRVRGITTNLFFYTHNFKEETVHDSASRSNQQEADMTLALANYLMQQGYEPTDVTILAAYSGQMFYLKKERQKYAFLAQVKITVIDNYQGEESKIILLSLVRNNDENRIGFLGTENRICVALSRAREGFYIFGNIDLLQANSPLWTKIAKTLEDGGFIGSAFVLKCESHPSQVTRIGSLQDFEKVPEGGCLLMCNYNLPACGHPCPKICHGYDRSHSDTNCLLNCERVICELGHVCPLKCAEPCSPCVVLVRKTLPCGHTMRVQCHLEPDHPSVKCLTVVTVKLPHCQHETRKACHLDARRVPCSVPCAARVEPCGHACRRRCHVTDDPDHEKYLCEKQCSRAKKGCTAELIDDRGDHQCPKQCHEACDDCNVEVTKKRSTCKHSQRVACSKDANETPCLQKCARVLPCGHFCKKKCFEKCGDCDQMVKKVVPDCQHTIEIACKREATRAMCPHPCVRPLPCGHACRGRCDQPCDPALCDQRLPEQHSAPCGHKVQLPCNVKNAFDRSGKEEEKLNALLLKYCTMPCDVELKCSHACAGRCGACHQGRLHAPCASRCHVVLICGHRCEEPCNQLCPPCKKPCEVKCQHTQCKKLCGAPCVPCQEKCTRKCPHGACKRRCGAACERPACARACARRLRCDHPCRGLCGEPCPPVCAQCRPDDFPTDEFNEPYDENAKFIQLQDCLHVLEVEFADGIMNTEGECIKIPACPTCRKPIINTYRYKDLVNKKYKEEINPIKEKLYGTAERVKEKQTELSAEVAAFKERHASTMKENTFFKNTFHKLLSVVRTQKKISLLQLEMHFVYINIMDMIGINCENYKKANLTELKYEFDKLVAIICVFLCTNIKKLSQQQQEDIGNEMKRMSSIIQLAKIFNHELYVMTKSLPKVKELAEVAKSHVLSWKVFKEVDALTALKKLQDAIKVSGIVTQEERALVVKAIPVKQGSWFKCPNGHFYCIGECGGAMQEGRCIECKAPVGGSSHRLLPSNQHAPEIDGSRYAAYSEEYNNMANFNLDFED